MNTMEHNQSIQQIYKCFRYFNNQSVLNMVGRAAPYVLGVFHLFFRIYLRTNSFKTL
jgi:hypothetical protein